MSKEKIIAAPILEGEELQEALAKQKKQIEFYNSWGGFSVPAMPPGQKYKDGNQEKTSNGKRIWGRWARITLDNGNQESDDAYRKRMQAKFNDRKLIPADVLPSIGYIFGTCVADVDLDCPLARAYGEQLLPDTGARYGRETAPEGPTHRVYRLKTPDNKRKRKTYGSVELRTGQNQTVFPPSYHKSGVPLIWTGQGRPQPEIVEYDDLHRAVKLIAIAVLLHDQVHEGIYHDSSLYIAGGLLHMGIPLDEARRFMRVFAEETGQQGLADRDKSVVGTYKRGASEENVKGWRGLSEECGINEDIVKDILKITAKDKTDPADDFPPEDIERLQSREKEIWVNFAYRAHGVNKPLIYDLTKSRKKCTMPESGFRGYLGKEIIMNEEGKLEEAAKCWLRSTDKRIITEDVFIPGQPRLIPDGSSGHFLHNLYMPTQLKPVEGVNEAELFFEHMEYIFPQPERREFMHDLFAHLIQNPHIRLNFAPAIIGKTQGTGKTAVPSVLSRLVGKHNTVNPDMEKLMGMKGHFNDYLAQRILCIISEVRMNTYMARLGSMETLKSLITDDEHYIEEKYKSGDQSQIYINFFFTSNHRDALILPEGDRRFWVHEVTAQARSEAYYEALWNMIKHNDRAMGQLLNWYQNRLLDSLLTDFNPKRPPDTPEKEIMIMYSETGIEGLFKDIFKSPVEEGKRGIEIATEQQVKTLLQFEQLRLNGGEEVDSKDQIRLAAIRRTLPEYGELILVREYDPKSSTQNRREFCKVKWKGSSVTAWLLDQSAADRYDYRLNPDIRGIVRDGLDFTQDVIEHMEKDAKNSLSDGIEHAKSEEMRRQVKLVGGGDW